MSDYKIHDVRFLGGDSAFLLDDGEVSILYDSGFGFTGYLVAENIKKILGDRKLNFIFLTHSHYDHALGSAYILRYYPDAVVVAGKYAADIFSRAGAKRVMKELDRNFADKCGFSDYEFLGDELRVDVPVSDGDVIDAGNMTFEVVNLPGHTKCSVGYYCREKKLLLSTETVGLFAGDGLIVPSYLVGYQLALDSIEKVSEINPENILSPHYGLLTKEETRFFLDNMKESSVKPAMEILTELKQGKPKEDIIHSYINKYRQGYVKEIYPIDAAVLNTSIMVDLIEKELM